MRIRKLSAVFWSTCIIAFVFILYIVTDLSLKLPSIKPVMRELDDSKWSSLESKLRHIEKELSHHHAVVGEIRSAVDQIVDSPDEFKDIRESNVEAEAIAEQNAQIPKVPDINKNLLLGKDKLKKSYVEKFTDTVKFNKNVSCPVQMDVAPKTDIQMLSMYERMDFEDIDGGVWKQGWDVKYKEDRYNRINKLKVYIVPHSHNDPGWIKTFENYYKTQTRSIFNNMVEKLVEGVGRKFIWAETSYLSMWWDSDATDKGKAVFKNLLNSGQIEIVTGGWVMNDEASSHWLSIAQQLTTGHQWLIDKLEYIPKNHWSIDPFGYSSTQPYLLNLAGFENSIIQRVHYRVKKELALNKQLEFKWRQLWDGVGKTDMFTHMMPFYSYDIPHTCGPDPKICCQFDFKRLPGNGVTCPWGIPPRKIVEKNVDERSHLILDQWRKKAELYRSNVLFVPLGDDFRYDRANEWDQQYKNYEMIIDYINSNEAWNAEVQFGTLQDYFKALHDEVKLTDFPVLSGDFFTYSDRNDHYWSGYYTSRPFYKNMDRVLLGYLRAAEIITSQAMISKSVSEVVSLQLRDKVEQARRALSLFQHHDGITGTSKDEVRRDYARKLQKAILHSQSTIQQAAYHLLRQPQIEGQNQEDVYFDIDDIWSKEDSIPSRITISLDEVSPSRKIVLYNALMFRRTELVNLIVSTPHVEVFDQDQKPMTAQVSLLAAGRVLNIVANKYQLTFPVTVNPLSIATYTVAVRKEGGINRFTSYSMVRIYNADYWSTSEIPKMFAVDQPSARLVDDITLQAGDSTRVVATSHGLIKAVVSPRGVTTPVHMDYVTYESKHEMDSNSGAYLFMPNGPAAPLKPNPYPEIVVTEGPFIASLYVALTGPDTAPVILTITVRNNPSLPHAEVEVSNWLELGSNADDKEVVMRLSTNIKNGDVFYTDLNGFQMIKRRYFKKLPLQANFYPLPGATYIEDDNTRLTVLTSTPLGMGALQAGQIEIVQDRRLTKDDNLGVGQGVLDNVPTRHNFRILVEHQHTPCSTKKPADHPSGLLSLGAHVSQQLLLQPLVAMHYTAPAHPAPDTPASYTGAITNHADLVLATFHSHVAAKSKSGKIVKGMGMTLHRVLTDTCYDNKEISEQYPIGDGRVLLTDLARVRTDQMYESSLSFVHIKNPVPEGILTLCPMEVRSVFLNHTMKHG